MRLASRWFFAGTAALLLPLLVSGGVRAKEGAKHLGETPEATSAKEFDARCAACHGEIYRSYMATPMANASGIAEDKLIPGSIALQAPGLRYTISSEHGEPTLTVSSKSASDAPVQRKLSYFLGSGHLATTYLYSVDRFLFESPAAWYPAGGYDMKPGLALMKKVPPSIPMQSECMRCHMSNVQASDSGTLNRYSGLPFLHTGITCETCHGDAAQHGVNGNRGGILSPKMMTADQRDSVCIGCHLEGDVSVEHAGRNTLNYKPGESISSYLSFYVYGGADITKRGVSEVEQFARSTCKQASGDKMSCTSCHDPHFTPSATQRTSFFRAKCLACHSEPQFASTHHAENQDCTSCHMQRTGAENIPHVAWTDHRILRVPEKSTMASAEAIHAELQPVFSPQADDRDLALANYKLMLGGNGALGRKAWEMLRQQGDAIAKDEEALNALAVMDAEAGNLDAAEELFRRVLAMDPDNLTALSNLGTLIAKKGDLKESEATLERAFARNQNISGLAMNLARVQCASGEPEAARVTLNTMLVYNPGLAEAQRYLAQLSSCGRKE